MKKYMGLSIKELVSEVAVDPVHTKELADSIMSRGQLAPVIIREDTKEVIDGFHRIAAMKELGFDQVECVVTPCDDESFWDFRIIQASLHKNITFSRAVDWVDKVFHLSPWTERYKNARSLFSSVSGNTAPKEVEDWAVIKAKVWGLAPSTIASWLYTKESLEPSLLKEVKKGTGTRVPTDTYIEVASKLPTRPELQRPVIEKAAKEDLSSKQVREVAQAIRRAEDEEEVQSILRQPISRTEDQMVREAKVEKLLSEREKTPIEERQEAKREDVLYKLDLLGIINSTRAMTQEKINVLTPEQKLDVYDTCKQAITEISRIMDMIRPAIPAEYQLEE